MLTESPGHPHTFSARVCPVCGSTHVHRSRRRMVERWTGFLRPDQRMYRCHTCQHRFWDNKKGASRYVVSSSDLRVVESGTDAVPSDSSRTSSKKRTRRRRRKGKDGMSDFRRFQAWLYRKHNMTVDILVLFILLAVLVIVFFYWAMDQWM